MFSIIIFDTYKENSDQASDMRNMFSNSANTIITNSTMVEKILADDEVYALKSKKDLEEEMLQEKENKKKQKKQEKKENKESQLKETSKSKVKIKNSKKKSN